MIGMIDTNKLEKETVKLQEYILSRNLSIAEMEVLLLSYMDVIKLRTAKKFFKSKQT